VKCLLKLQGVNFYLLVKCHLQSLFRLGIMAKINNDFDISLKHFNMSLTDTSSRCSFTPHEIRFHIAHVHEVRGESHKAKEQYDDLLKEADISASLKADVYRQLGWMFHSVEALGERPARLHTAIQYLQRSNECSTKKNHGQTLYLLGRCFAGLGKVHEAFVAYRNSVDKSESNADTWCSIGVLYQQQAQPMDALQVKNKNIFSIIFWLQKYQYVKILYKIL
jgi:histone demethylase